MSLLTRRRLLALSSLFAVSLFSLRMISGTNFELSASNGLHDLKTSARGHLSRSSFVHLNGSGPPNRLFDGKAISLYDNETLGIASNIYVVSLPRRTDRRTSMEHLRQTLGLRWTYVDATPSDSDAVRNIIEHVRSQRDRLEDDVRNGLADDSFQWPGASEIDNLAISGSPLGISSSDYWAFRSPLYYDADASSLLHEGDATGVELGIDLPGLIVTSDNVLTLHDPLPRLMPLTCATQNYVTGLPYSPSLPGYMLLTPAKVACWHSHLGIIRKVAEGDTYMDTQSDGGVDTRMPNDVALVLEDDIDMERDIHNRLEEVWGLLPPEWDIVFLGHCWSNESYYPALASALPNDNDNDNDVQSQSSPRTSVHPSFSPKCTHAYALSRTGARRLLLHLQRTPFAYSRALDQALSWLILSERLKAYSVVPSVIVQRKVGRSDIDASGGGIGSGWRERLQDGVLGS